jgi:hypothetical protein
MDGD